MDITCISDLHGFYPILEGGDLLIVAGDLTARDEPKQYLQFNDWLKEQDYKKKIVIGGNHDNCLQSGIIVFVNPLLAQSMIPIYGPDVTYLCDSGTEFEYEEQEDTKWGPKMTSTKLKIWGSPWTKTFEVMNPKCKAFTVDTEEELASKFSLIPDDVDILVTHSPPIGVLDRTIDNRFVGSISLSAQLGFLNNLKIHVFGHIHESHGNMEPPAYLPNYFDVCKHYSINASHVNERYQPVNKPVRVIL
jgi:Icc-related predicted phosphoesterase